MECSGFPLGQGQPDFFVFNLPGEIDGDDSVQVWSRPRPSAPAEVSLVLDDLGPYALNIRGARVIDGRWRGRVIILGDVDGLTVGPWLLRTSRLRAVSSAPSYELYVDLR